MRGNCEDQIVTIAPSGGGGITPTGYTDAFKVSAAGSIVAGDFVYYDSGYQYALPIEIDDIDVNPWMGVTTLKLSTNKAMIIYHDFSDFLGKAVIANWNDGWTFETPTTINTNNDNTISMDAVLLGTGQVAIVYGNFAKKIKVRTLTFDEYDVITANSPADIGDIYFNDYKTMVKLSSGKFMILAVTIDVVEEVPHDNLRAVICTVDGSEIVTIVSNEILESDNDAVPMRLVLLDTNRVMAAISYNSRSLLTKLVMITIDGDDVAMNSPEALIEKVVSKSDFRLFKISTSKAVAIYRDSNTGTGYAIIATVDGSEDITIGTAFDFTGTGFCGNSLDAISISATKYAILYYSQNGGPYILNGYKGGLVIINIDAQDAITSASVSDGPVDFCCWGIISPGVTNGTLISFGEKSTFCYEKFTIDLDTWDISVPNSTISKSVIYKQINGIALESGDIGDTINISLLSTEPLQE